MPVWNPAVADRTVRSLADIEAIEQTPFEDISPARSAYEILAIQAAERPDEPAVTFLPTAAPDGPAHTLSYAALFGAVTRAANLFTDLSGGEPPVVAIMLPILPQAHVALWGAAAAGVAMPLNFLLRVDELSHLVDSAKATVLVALGPTPGLDVWEKARALKARCPSLKAVLHVSGAPEPEDGVASFDASVAGQPGDRLVPERTFSLDGVAAYFHTGGTTGSPKLARHTNRNHLAMAFGVSRNWAIAPGEVAMNGLPIFHVGGALDVGLAVLAAGGQVLLMTPPGLRNPDVIRNIWALTERFGINLVGGVPTSVIAMLQIPVGDADISSIRMALTGGSPIPPGPAQQFEQTFKVGIRQVYGMTETAGNAVVGLRHGPTHRDGAAGVRTPYTQLRVVRLGSVGGALEDCAPGEAGLVILRGPTVTPGYTDPARDEGVMLGDGWLSTGDLGRLAPDGEVTITGRAKDIIIRSGHNIDPATIEDAISTHPDVLAAAAVGAPDTYAGELPAVFVSLKPGAAADTGALRDWLRANIAEPPAMPRFIHLIDTMPLTAVGKIYKPALRQRMITEVLSQRLADLPGPPQVEVGDGPAITVRFASEESLAELGAEVQARMSEYTLPAPTLAASAR